MEVISLRFVHVQIHPRSLLLPNWSLIEIRREIKVIQ